MFGLLVNDEAKKSTSNVAYFYIGLTVDMAKAATYDFSQCVNDFIDIVRM